MSVTHTVGSICDILDRAYPPRLAADWDRVGLICGERSAEVNRVAFALDCTQAVAEEAVRLRAELLVVHHPLLLRGVTSVAADTPKGKVLHTLIRGGVALFAAHTNADCARPGVNDKLAEVLGLHAGRPIVPSAGEEIDKWGVQVPAGDAPALKAALFAAGAGHIGDYAECAFEIEGTGQFKPVAGAHPTLGHIGEVTRAPELRIEFVAPRRARRALIEALRRKHPFEEPALDIVPLADDTDPATACGLGRICELPRLLTLREFTQQVADALPVTVWGVRAAGDPEKTIKRVAVCSGAGDSLLDTVRGLGVDAYVTSDLRHHPVDEYLRAGGPAIIDTAHWASEFPWTSQAAELVDAATSAGTRGVDTRIIDIRTDPWTVSAHPRE